VLVAELVYVLFFLNNPVVAKRALVEFYNQEKCATKVVLKMYANAAKLPISKFKSL